MKVSQLDFEGDERNWILKNTHNATFGGSQFKYPEASFIKITVKRREYISRSDMNSDTTTIYCVIIFLTHNIIWYKIGANVDLRKPPAG